MLGNFPLSPRVRTLLLARNRISTIQPALPNAIPNLKNLMLASNKLSELSDLDVLGRFSRLTHLVLVDNPVTKKEVCSAPDGGASRRRQRCGSAPGLTWGTAHSTTGTGWSGGARLSASSTSKRSRTQRGRRASNCSAPRRHRQSWRRR